MYTTVFGKMSRFLYASPSLGIPVFMSPSTHFALSHEVNVVDAVGQLGVLVNGDHVVAVVALHLPRSQELLLLPLSPRPGALLAVPQSLPLPSPSLRHHPLPSQLQNPRLLLVHTAAIARVQAQRAVLQLDVGDAPSPAVEHGVDLRHRHVHAVLQRASAHRHPDEGQVPLHRAQFDKVVRVHSHDGEVETLQVEGVVQHGGHAAAVLVGEADDVRADAAVSDGEFHPLSEDGATAGKDFLVLGLGTSSTFGFVDLTKVFQLHKGLQLPLNLTLNSQQRLQNKDSTG